MKKFSLNLNKRPATTTVAEASTNTVAEEKTLKKPAAAVATPTPPPPVEAKKRPLKVVKENTERFSATEPTQGVLFKIGQQMLSCVLDNNGGAHIARINLNSVAPPIASKISSGTVIEAYVVEREFKGQKTLNCVGVTIAKDQAPTKMSDILDGIAVYTGVTIPFEDVVVALVEAGALSTDVDGQKVILENFGEPIAWSEHGLICAQIAENK